VEVRVTAGGTVSVRDHGPGIPESERQLVFRRFWRRDRARAGGAGLGLAIVERVAQAYRGTIRIEGASGSGAMFVLTLPLAR
jgi:signal transduction histidine kinase